MVMLHGTIRNDDFYRNTALQHCCDIVSNGYNCNIALCFAKNRRCESSRVTSPLVYKTMERRPCEDCEYQTFPVPEFNTFSLVIFQENLLSCWPCER